MGSIGPGWQWPWDGDNGPWNDWIQFDSIAETLQNFDVSMPYLLAGPLASSCVQYPLDECADRVTILRVLTEYFPDPAEVRQRYERGAEVILNKRAAAVDSLTALLLANECLCESTIREAFENTQPVPAAFLERLR